MVSQGAGAADRLLHPDGVVYFGAAPDASPHRVHEISHALFARGARRSTGGSSTECSSRARPSARSTRCAGAPNRLRTSASPTASRPCACTGRCRPRRVADWARRRTTRALVEQRSTLPRQLRGTLLGEALAEAARVARGRHLLGYVLGVANSLAVADGLPLSEQRVGAARAREGRARDRYGLRELARARGSGARGGPRSHRAARPVPRRRDRSTRACARATRAEDDEPNEHDAAPTAWKAVPDARLRCRDVARDRGWLARRPGAAARSCCCSAASLGALVTAGLWLWILAARRSLGWAVGVLRSRSGSRT